MEVRETSGIVDWGCFLLEFLLDLPDCFLDDCFTRVLTVSFLNVEVYVSELELWIDIVLMLSSSSSPSLFAFVKHVLHPFFLLLFIF